MSNPISVRFIRVMGASLAAHMATLAAVYVHGVPTFPADRLGLAIALVGALGAGPLTHHPSEGATPEAERADAGGLHGRRRGRR